MQRTLSGTVLVACLALLAAARPLAAQAPPPVVQDPPVVVQQPPVVQDPPVVTPPTDPDLVMKPEQALLRIDPQRRREQITAMEGLLTAAVKSAATAAARQLQRIEPTLQLVTGPARAKGVYLEDYGVFFHVEIPGVQPSMAWVLESMVREPSRFEGAQPARASSRNAGGFDADAAYVMAVQQKLVDMMLDYRIDLQPNEWLTVAAQSGEAPANLGEIVESPMMILRVRASDLADYYHGRITREEIRQRVEVREF